MCSGLRLTRRFGLETRESVAWGVGGAVIGVLCVHGLRLTRHFCPEMCGLVAWGVVGATGKVLELPARGDCNASSNESTRLDQQFHGHIGAQSDDGNNHGKASMARNATVPRD